MAKIPRIIRRRHAPSSGLRDPQDTSKLPELRAELTAVLEKLPEQDREFARSLLAAPHPTTRQIFFMRALIDRAVS